MIFLKNIRPLSDFVRNAKAHLGRLKKSGQPEVLTVNGEAQAVILSTDAYEKLIEELETERTLNVVHQSALEDFRSGRISGDALLRDLRPAPHLVGLPAEQVFADLEKKFQLRRKKKAS